MSNYSERMERAAQLAIDSAMEVTGRKPGNVVQLFRDGSEQDVDLAPYMRSLPKLDRLIGAGSVSSEDLWHDLTTPYAAIGEPLPWPKISKWFRLRPSEVTAIIGPNGEKKTTMQAHIMAWLALQGRRVLSVSLEMTVRQQMAMMVKQTLANPDPDFMAMDAVRERLGEALTFWNHVGMMQPDAVLALVRWAAREDGAQYVFIDNLTSVVPPSRNSDEQQAKFINQLVQITRAEGVHVFLTGHVRKPAPGAFLTRYDWRGTGAASDYVDNVLVVQRRPDKKNDTDDEAAAPDLGCDTIVTVDKQRNGPPGRTFRYWHDEQSRRLFDDPHDSPAPYYNLPIGEQQ